MKVETKIVGWETKIVNGEVVSCKPLIETVIVQSKFKRVIKCKIFWVYIFLFTLNVLVFLLKSNFVSMFTIGWVSGYIIDHVIKK